LARIAGVDLPRQKRIEIGLTYIYGIGPNISRRILQKLNIDLDTKTDDFKYQKVNGFGILSRSSPSKVASGKRATHKYKRSYSERAQKICC